MCSALTRKDLLKIVVARVKTIVPQGRSKTLALLYWRDRSLAWAYVEQ
jgi:hypothetical protein